LSKTLMPIISRKIKPDSIVCTDSYSSCNTLDVSRFHHERVNHGSMQGAVFTFLKKPPP